MPDYKNQCNFKSNSCVIPHISGPIDWLNQGPHIGYSFLDTNLVRILYLHNIYNSFFIHKIYDKSVYPAVGNLY